MKKLNKEDLIEKIKHFYFEEDDVSLDETAKRVGISRTTINKLFKEFGIKAKPRKKKERSRDFIEKVKYLYLDEKKSLLYIVHKVGISYANLIKLFRDNDIPIRDRTEAYKLRGYPIGHPKRRVSVSEKEKQKIKELFNNYLSLQQIAKIMSKSRHVITRVVKELGLSRDQIKGGREYDGTKDQEFIDLYLEGKSMKSISKQFGVSRGYIKYHLVRNGIEIRDLSKAQLVFLKKEPSEDLNDYNKLYDLYIVKKESIRSLSKLYNVSDLYIKQSLLKLNIPLRTPSEAHKGVQVGQNHPNWKGGITSLYMRVRETLLREQVPVVLKRDNYTCQYDGCNCKSNLHVHHIIPFNKIIKDILEENQVTDNTLDERKEELFNIIMADKRILDLDNLITYCSDCHLFKIHGYKRRKTNNKNKK